MKQKQQLNQSLVAALNTSPLPILHDHNLSSFNTKPYLLQLLQNCKDFISATLTHSTILKSGFSNDTFTTNHQINYYVRLGQIHYAHKLFDEMPEPNVVSWTSLMAGYVNVGQPKMALKLFEDMQRSSVRSNEFTLATVINACAMLANFNLGRRLHAHLEVLGFQSNLVVSSSLIDMYGKCNEVHLARQVFDSMCSGNVVTWTSMITAYAQNALGNKALQLFKEFSTLMSESPNHFMLASVINACASLGRLVKGKASHGLVICNGHGSNEVVASALVDMYAKCGCFEYSDKVFRRIPNPSVIPYTSMIVSAAKYGCGTLAQELFKEMVDRSIKPNDITFIGVLHACSHSGLTDKGLEYFNSMEVKYGVKPSAKHFTCVVDMLGRVGRLEEAYKLAKSVKVEGDEGSLLWGTLLSASRLFGRVDIAVEASRLLIESNQQVANAYVTLSNTYVLAGDWDHAHNLRHKMKHTGIRKEPGCSWVEIKDSTFVFYAGDISSCAQGSEILSLLRELESRMKERGYVGGSNGLVFVDVEEEAKEEIVSLHSERLALAYGLMNTAKGVTIRVMKNLRMCRDCHEAFKLISEIVERDFLVRDVNRFHHFENGSCTCRDFW